MNMRKYVKESNLDENTNKVLKFFEDLIREDIIDSPSVSDAFFELGFEVDICRTKVDNPGGSIILRWAY